MACATTLHSAIRGSLLAKLEYEASNQRNGPLRRELALGRSDSLAGGGRQ